MKINVPARKPRNPLVAATRFRRAGSHDRCLSGQRQQAQRMLRQELERLKPSP